MAKPLFDATTTHHGNLAELCPVVAGAIVSKPLIDTGALKEILFAMDAGQEISEHRSPFLATVHVLTGRLRMIVSGTAHVLEANSWLSMPPDAPHALLAELPTRFLLTMVRITDQALS